MTTFVAYQRAGNTYVPLLERCLDREASGFRTPLTRNYWKVKKKGNKAKGSGTSLEHLGGQAGCA
ncbi:Exportin 1-like family protein [Aspergillus niger]|uniref:Exportin 1-like family protein n=1 Tax=Aspergillus niger TaxID=5061 RepID=A0A505IAT2_ASPNG|nr:Exportin 1-like family protein [Aspergillus niger]